jgi:hypothetical protein
MVASVVDCGRSRSRPVATLKGNRHYSPGCPLDTRFLPTKEIAEQSFELV